MGILKRFQIFRLRATPCLGNRTISATGDNFTNCRTSAMTRWTSVPPPNYAIAAYRTDVVNTPTLPSTMPRFISIEVSRRRRAHIIISKMMPRAIYHDTRAFSAPIFRAIPQPRRRHHAPTTLEAESRIQASRCRRRKRCGKPRAAPARRRSRDLKARRRLPPPTKIDFVMLVDFLGQCRKIEDDDTIAARRLRHAPR